MRWSGNSDDNSHRVRKLHARNNIRNWWAQSFLIRMSWPTGQWWETSSIYYLVRSNKWVSHTYFNKLTMVFLLGVGWRIVFCLGQKWRTILKPFCSCCSVFDQSCIPITIVFICIVHCSHQDLLCSCFSEDPPFTREFKRIRAVAICK